MDKMEIKHKKEMNEMEIQQKILSEKIYNLEKLFEIKKNSWW